MVKTMLECANEAEIAVPHAKRWVFQAIVEESIGAGVFHEGFEPRAAHLLECFEFFDLRRLTTPLLWPMASRARPAISVAPVRTLRP